MTGCRCGSCRTARVPSLVPGPPPADAPPRRPAPPAATPWPVATGDADIPQPPGKLPAALCFPGWSLLLARRPGQGCRYTGPPLIRGRDLGPEGATITERTRAWPVPAGHCASADHRWTRSVVTALIVVAATAAPLQCALNRIWNLFQGVVYLYRPSEALKSSCAGRFGVNLV